MVFFKKLAKPSSNIKQVSLLLFQPFSKAVSLWINKKKAPTRSQQKINYLNGSQARSFVLRQDGFELSYLIAVSLTYFTVYGQYNFLIYKLLNAAWTI